MLNTREKMAHIADWLGQQNEMLSDGLRSIADAERLYDYLQKHTSLLPEYADDDSDTIEMCFQRVAALGYDPLFPEESIRLTQKAVRRLCAPLALGYVCIPFRHLTIHRVSPQSNVSLGNVEVDMLDGFGRRICGGRFNAVLPHLTRHLNASLGLTAK